MAKRGRKKKVINPKELRIVELERIDVEHIIFQLEIYGVPEMHKVCRDEIENHNEKICKILRRVVAIYPKSTLISPPLTEK